MDLSVVIPLYNESESIDELNNSINNILNNSSLDYELIYIDDGSVDISWEKIKDICKNQNKVSAYRFLKTSIIFSQELSVLPSSIYINS